MPDTGERTHVSSQQEAAVIMAYLRSKSSAKRVKASVGSKTRSSDPLIHISTEGAADRALYSNISTQKYNEIDIYLLTKNCQ